MYSYARPLDTEKTRKFHEKKKNETSVNGEVNQVHRLEASGLQRCQFSPTLTHTDLMCSQ